MFNITEGVVFFPWDFFIANVQVLDTTVLVDGDRSSSEVVDFGVTWEAFQDPSFLLSLHINDFSECVISKIF